MKTLFHLGLTSLLFFQLNGCSSPDVNEIDKPNNANAETITTPTNVDKDDKASDSSASDSVSLFPDLKVTVSGRSFTHAQILDFFSCVATQATNIAFKTPSEKYLNELEELKSETDEAQFRNKLARIATNIQASESFSGTECKAQSS